jgi:molecular chaperone GrpE (heat shock protein)
MDEGDRMVLDDPSATGALAPADAGPSQDRIGIQVRLDRIEQRLADLAAALAAPSGPTGLTEALASLEKQISRAGREQFKASTLAEAQRDQMQEALAALQSAAAEHDLARDDVRGQAATIATQARLAVARSIIPALDGLDEALRSGQRLAAAPAAPATQERRWFQRARQRSMPDDALRADLRAWLEGLAFVRERLLAVLAAEGITPIPAQGQQFDPAIHMGVEASPPTPDAPPGSVAAVIRQGYLLGDQVLRPAEVAVVRIESKGEAG